MKPYPIPAAMQRYKTSSFLLFEHDFRAIQMTKKKRLHLFLPATNKHHIHKCKSAPVLSSSPRYEDTWLSRGTAPSISNVRTRRRRIISFTEDKSPRVCVEQGAVWAQEEMWALWSRDIQGIHKRMVMFRKLTGNLFLTLHGHNVHRQQRQLSKFLMRYQQFASHAHCGAAEPVSNMASQQEKAFRVLRFDVSRSVITVQREFRARRTHGACVFSKACTKLTLHCNHRSGYIKTEHTESLFLLRRHIGNWPGGPAVSMRSELLVAHEKLGQLPLLTVYVMPV